MVDATVLLRHFELVLRTPGDTTPLIPAERSAVRELGPSVPVIRIRTLQQIRATSLDQERLLLSLLTGFTLVALLLAALGTYGVIAFTVQQRTPEIGLRLALGAQGRDILQLIRSHAAQGTALGALLGLVGALVGSRLLSAMLYQTRPSDPWSYVLAIAALALVAFPAAMLPARRATRVDPLVALRAE